jgi:hypothetical protein
MHKIQQTIIQFSTMPLTSHVYVAYMLLTMRDSNGILKATFIQNLCVSL